MHQTAKNAPKMMCFGGFSMFFQWLGDFLGCMRGGGGLRVRTPHTLNGLKNHQTVEKLLETHQNTSQTP